MDEVYINTYDMAKWVREKHFNNKDFITLDEFYRVFEELSDAYEILQEEFDKMTQDAYDEHEDYC
ncbi:MAG: hypothetical protein IKV94_02570 [Clostridia bacterium]|nr:hypothetical protein [Clostridia bacterium]MBR6517100.1 hypothetical protein [Bacilli bacterium]